MSTSYRQIDVPARTGVWSVTKQGTGSFTCSNASSLVPVYSSLHEELVDSDRGRRNDNDVYHIKIIADQPQTTFNYSVRSSSTATGYCLYTTDDPGFRFRQHHPLVDSGAYGADGMKGLTGLSLSFPGEQIDLAKENGLIYAWPRIREQISLLNATFELKDVRRLPEVMRRVITLVRSYPNWVKFWQRGKRNRKLVLRELFNLSSNAYLSNEFGIKPLLRDLASVSTGVDSAIEQLDKLLKMSGKRVRVYYTQDLSSFVPESDTSNLVMTTGRPDGDRHYRKVERLAPAQFRSVVEYSFRMPDLSRARLEARAVRDAYGLNFNPQIIWNAIPWSFVIDWFVGVDRWLGNFRMNWLDPEVHIYRYCWSIKASRRVTLKTKYSEGGPVSPTVTLRQQDEYFYKRSTDPVDWAAYVNTSGLNLKEFSYIGALIGARI